MSEAVLTTRNLRKTFGALVATDDVSIDLKPGEIHAIIGPNGAGKSTLIGQICGGIKPDSGTVYLGGSDVTKLSTVERAQAGLGRTFQISALAMEDTVLENVLLGAVGQSAKPWRFWLPALKERDLIDRSVAALERVGLAEARHQVAANLSHGQRRQLEVAVALTLAPQVFVLDEPMAGLGTEGSKTMTEFLSGLRVEAPILLVEHDMDAVFALADRITVLVYGGVVASGSVHEIKSSVEVRQAYLGEEA